MSLTARVDTLLKGVIVSSLPGRDPLFDALYRQSRWIHEQLAFAENRKLARCKKRRIIPHWSFSGALTHAYALPDGEITASFRMGFASVACSTRRPLRLAHRSLLGEFQCNAWSSRECLGSSACFLRSRRSAGGVTPSCSGRPESGWTSPPRAPLLFHEGYLRLHVLCVILIVSAILSDIIGHRSTVPTF